jgi:hypothetical protein
MAIWARLRAGTAPRPCIEPPSGRLRSLPGVSHMTTADIVELRETVLPPRARSTKPPKDATVALRARRAREKRNEIKSAVTPEVTKRHGANIAAYAAASALAGAAAYFSVRGMATLFPGDPVPVIAMASMMEGAKLVTAGWLARRWRTTTAMSRTILVTLVGGLAVINATGVYAQLVAAHVGERGAATSAVETQDAALAARIEVVSNKIADLDRQTGQIDNAVAEATRRGKTSTALAAMEGQRKARAALVSERQREAGGPCRPELRACQRGRQRAPDRD